MINIKELRIEHSLTQEELAEYLQVSRQTIIRWEKNQTIPQPYMLRKLKDIQENGLSYKTKLNLELSGIWIGYVYQKIKGLQTTEEVWGKYPAIMIKEFINNTLTGNAMTYAYTLKQPRYLPYKIQGYLYTENHYKVNYQKVNQLKKENFGSSMLTLTNNNQLKGTFAGFSTVDNKTIMGEINLKKITGNINSAETQEYIIQNFTKTIQSNNFAGNKIPDVESEIDLILKALNTSIKSKMKIHEN